MKKIAMVGYRNWALNIYENIKKHRHVDTLLISSKKDFNDEKIIEYMPDIVLFYGWSWKVSEKLINKFDCLMLHPSPLPKYRGGSPIQNQIIAGETSSKVSIIIMNNEMDAGDIVGQKSFSLEGTLEEIFQRISSIGTSLTIEILDKGFKKIQQDHAKATYFKRRLPEESEITMDELKNKSSTYIYNKIRMLADPYPNAFIKTKDGKKILIKEACISSE